MNELANINISSLSPVVSGQSNPQRKYLTKKNHSSLNVNMKTQVCFCFRVISGGVDVNPHGPRLAGDTACLS